MQKLEFPVMGSSPFCSVPVILTESPWLGFIISTFPSVSSLPHSSAIRVSHIAPTTVLHLT